MATVPQSLDDVTVEWLADELDVAIDSVEVERIAAGEGFMGELARVHISSPEAAAPATVIVKLPTADPGGRFIGELMRVWEREHGFYRDVAPLMEIRVPTALVNVADPPCLVLEDLAPAVVGDHVAGASLDQAERAIDALSRLHAAWFEHPLLSTLTWMPGLDDPSILTLGDTFAMGWPLFLERFSGELPARCLRWCERFVDGVPDWIAGHLDAPVTLTHGDYRLDNLFFDRERGEVIVADWQTPLRGLPAMDVAYFISGSLALDVSSADEEALLDDYHAELVARGITEYDRDTLSRDYRLCMLLVLQRLVLTESDLVDIGGVRGEALLACWFERTARRLDGVDLESLASRAAA
jgi:aminoglycoside/choline kinase family phosphotransferase